MFIVFNSVADFISNVINNSLFPLFSWLAASRYDQSPSNLDPFGFSSSIKYFQPLGHSQILGDFPSVENQLLFYRFPLVYK